MLGKKVPISTKDQDKEIPTNPVVSKSTIGWKKLMEELAEIFKYGYPY